MTASWNRKLQGWKKRICNLNLNAEKGLAQRYAKDAKGKAWEFCVPHLQGDSFLFCPSKILSLRSLRTFARHFMVGFNLNYPAKNLRTCASLLSKGSPIARGGFPSMLIESQLIR